MSLATHVRRDRVVRRSPSAQTIQLGVVAIGVVLVVVLAAHGHDAAALVGGVSAHAVFETGVMSAAMMLPVAALAVPLVMQRSLRHRRVRASCWHVIGFALVWFVFGAVVSVVVGAFVAGGILTELFVVVGLGALAWQLSDRRAIIVRRCGRLRSSPPRGVRADIGVMIAGADQASWCLRTCALMMTAMILAPHPAVMGLLWAANLSEWAPGPNPFGRARRLRPAVVLAATAAVSGLVAAFG